MTPLQPYPDTLSAWPMTTWPHYVPEIPISRCSGGYWRCTTGHPPPPHPTPPHPTPALQGLTLQEDCCSFNEEQCNCQRCRYSHHCSGCGGGGGGGGGGAHASIQRRVLPAVVAPLQASTICQQTVLSQRPAAKQNWSWHGPPMHHVPLYMYVPVSWHAHNIINIIVSS